MEVVQWVRSSYKVSLYRSPRYKPHNDVVSQHLMLLGYNMLSKETSSEKLWCLDVPTSYAIN